MSPLEILIAARALIDTPKKWTKGVMARDIHGVKVHSNDRDAVCFCIFGSTHRTLALNMEPMHSEAHRDLIDATITAEGFLEAAIKKLFRRLGGIAAFNDDPDTTHEMVMAVYDHAIAIAEASKS